MMDTEIMLSIALFLCAGVLGVISAWGYTCAMKRAGCGLPARLIPVSTALVWLGAMAASATGLATLTEALAVILVFRLAEAIVSTRFGYGRWRLPNGTAERQA